MYNTGSVLGITSKGPGIFKTLKGYPNFYQKSRNCLNHFILHVIVAFCILPPRLPLVWHCHQSFFLFLLQAFRLLQHTSCCFFVHRGLEISLQTSSFSGNSRLCEWNGIFSLGRYSWISRSGSQTRYTVIITIVVQSTRVSLKYDI